MRWHKSAILMTIEILFAQRNFTKEEKFRRAVQCIEPLTESITLNTYIIQNDYQLEITIGKYLTQKNKNPSRIKITFSNEWIEMHLFVIRNCAPKIGKLSELYCILWGPFFSFAISSILLQRQYFFPWTFELSKPMNTFHNSMCAMSQPPCISNAFVIPLQMRSIRHAMHFICSISRSTGFDVNVCAFFSDYLRDK